MSLRAPSRPPRRRAAPALLCGCLLAAGCALADSSGPRPAAAPDGAAEATAAAADPAALLELPTDRPLVAGFVIVDGVYNTELMAPWDVRW